MFHINTVSGRIPPYTVTMISAFLLGIGLLYLLNRRDKIPKQIAGFLLILAPVMILFHAIGMTYLTSHGTQFGPSSMGALIGMYLSAIVMGLICGDLKMMRKLLENCTFILPLMYAVSKSGCFFAGCCRGIPYTGVCSVIYTDGETVQPAAFPVQLLESLIFLLIFLLGMLLRKKKKRRGGSVWIVFLTAAAAKGLLDFLRAEHQGKLLSLNQILCIGLIGIGMILLLGNYTKQKRAAS